MEERILSKNIIESLRKGIPPRRGIDKYSVGHEELIESIKEYHLQDIEYTGIIRFLSGSWGSGKTHLFRILTELAFQNNFLVSNVELKQDSTPLNKFQTVFAEIIKQISSPKVFAQDNFTGVSNFGNIIYDTLLYLASDGKNTENAISHEKILKATRTLMANHGIDIDFKKMVKKYWDTFLTDTEDEEITDQVRSEILQWFFAEGTAGTFKKEFGVSKIITKANAKLMLESLASFTKLSGYNGLVILFDEAEQAYSLMRKAQLKEAHNNLLSLINNIENLQGIYMIYATTPDFYNDPKHGIGIYGALSQRIGRPGASMPHALDIVWNLDAVDTRPEYYKEAAEKIRNIYISAIPQAASKLTDTDKFVDDLLSGHSRIAGINFWRLLVQSLIAFFDDTLKGRSRSVAEIKEDIMDRLRES